MKNRHTGKWFAFCTFVALLAASGTTCPSQMPAPTPTLAGLWSGVISGDVTTAQTVSAVPPNPNPTTVNVVSRTTSSQQFVFNDSGLPLALPLQVSGFSFSPTLRAVTAFNVGETQTFMDSTMVVAPAGAANTFTQESVRTTTLTVTESTLLVDHFRVFYAVTTTETNTFTTLEPGFQCMDETRSSTGGLILEATATDGLMTFTLDFNISGMESDTRGASPCPPAAPTTTTTSSSIIGILTGTLARDGP